MSELDNEKKKIISNGVDAHTRIKDNIEDVKKLRKKVESEIEGIDRIIQNPKSAKLADIYDDER